MRRTQGAAIANSTARVRPAKPYEGFPLFPHAIRRWAKMTRGKLRYFGLWADIDARLAKLPSPITSSRTSLRSLLVQACLDLRM